MRRYWVDIIPTAISAYTTDIVQLSPGSGKLLKVISLNLHQTSDFGDAQDEILSVKWMRGFSGGGSGGNSVTPVRNLLSDASAAFTASTFNTSAASGTPTILARHGFNVRAGLERIYAPEEWMFCPYSDWLVLRFEASPADAITLGGSVCVEEIG